MRYQKYKNFLPENIRVNKVNKINSNNRRTIFWIILLNSILLPLNLNKVSADKNTEEIAEEILYTYENKIESIKEWIDIDEHYYENILVEDNSGEIRLKDRKFAYDIEEDGFSIKEYKTIEEGIIIKVVKR
jgi:hypothetical protein